MTNNPPVGDPRVSELEAETVRNHRLLDLVTTSLLTSLLAMDNIHPPPEVDAAMAASMKGREQEIRAELRRVAALWGWHAAIKAYADPPPEKSAEEWEEEEEANSPYCRECGHEKVVYMAGYANGTLFKCAVCGVEILW